MTVGDWAWAQRTQGRLSRIDEYRYLLAASRALVAARRHRLPRTTRSLVVAASPPDSAFARAAFDATRELSSPALLAHCLRAWLWADLFAQAGSIQHDPELLYTACVLHDLGLTDAHWCRRSQCFAVEGALAAHDLAGAHHYPKTDALAEAIALHLNVAVPTALGAEAHLLHAGTTTDILGTGLAVLTGRVRAEVLQRHPRGDIHTGLIDRVQAQARARPRSRVAVLERRINFTDRLRRADNRFPKATT